jgi:hypothetical protein
MGEKFAGFELNVKALIARWIACGGGAKGINLTRPLFFAEEWTTRGHRGAARSCLNIAASRRV